MKAQLIRLKDNGKQTLGKLYAFKGVNEVFNCVTLEPSYVDNKKNISSICQGVYKCVKRYSEKYGSHFHVTDVQDRTLILLHHGNFRKDTRGCILLGEKFAYIDGDGQKDITNSKNTMDKFMSVMPDEFELTITVA